MNHSKAAYRNKTEVQECKIAPTLIMAHPSVKLALLALPTPGGSVEGFPSAEKKKTRVGDRYNAGLQQNSVCTALR